MKTEQEFDTPGEALMHVGVKGMRWGVRNATDNAVGGVKKAANTQVKNAKQGVQNAKSSASKTVDKKVQGVKQGAQNRADAKKAKVEAKAKAVGDNAVVKQVGQETKGWVWGTRQAYIEKTLKDAERAGNIAKGNAGIDSKVIAVKDGVVGKRSAKFANRVFEAHAERMRKGEIQTKDILLAGARLRRRDLTIGMDLAGKKNDRAKKRGKEGADFKINTKLVRAK